MPDDPLPILTWSVDDAFRQPENPDPAVNVSTDPAAPGALPPDLSVLSGAINLALAVMAVVETPLIQTLGGVFTVITSIIGVALSGGNERDTTATDLALKNNLDTMIEKMTGLNDIMTTLEGLDPVTHPDTYKAQLVAMNAVLTEALPEFMIASYRRQTAMLFVTAATIHLAVLRKLFDADGQTVWSDTLRTQAEVYSSWLAQTRQAILDQRAAEIGGLVPAPGSPTFLKNAIHDSRLVEGSDWYVFLGAAADADAARSDYIAKRLAMFRELAWVKNIETCILNWKQVNKLANRNNAAVFAPMPAGAVFPQHDAAASYWNAAARVAWSARETFAVAASATSPDWQTFTVPIAGQYPGRILVGGAAAVPTFTPHGGGRLVPSGGGGRAPPRPPLHAPRRLSHRPERRHHPDALPAARQSDSRQQLPVEGRARGVAEHRNHHRSPLFRPQLPHAPDAVDVCDERETFPGTGPPRRYLEIRRRNNRLVADGVDRRCHRAGGGRRLTSAAGPRHRVRLAQPNDNLFSTQRSLGLTHETLRCARASCTRRLPPQTNRRLPERTGRADLRRYAAQRSSSCVWIRRGAHAEHRRVARRLDPLSARVQPLSDDAAVASVDPHRTFAARAWGAKQHRLPLRRHEVPHARRGVAGARLSHRRRGVVIRAALRHRHRLRLRFLRRQHRRRRGGRRERTSALRVRDPAHRPAMARAKQCAAVLPLFSHLPAARTVRN